MKPDQPKLTFPFIEPWRVPGKIAQLLGDGGFQRVEEREIEAVSWWDDVEAAAYWITATLKMMVGKDWSEEEKGKMEERFREGLERGIREGSELVLRDGARVGFRNVAFAGLGWK